jgi:ketosteroid isomerase-like protein
MSDRDQEIISSLRRVYEAFSRKDFDTAIAIAHPEIELVGPGGMSSLRGADALRAWMEPDAIEDQQMEPREFHIKDNKVLVRQHTWGRGAGSGIDVEIDLWVVWTLNEDGLVTRIEGFLVDQESEALEAAGLSD